MRGSEATSVDLNHAGEVWEDIHPWNADFEDCLLEVAGFRHPSSYRSNRGK